MELKLTPMIQQYKKIKRSIPQGAILMFRLGDFYEMFFEDAKIASRLLNIALTRRSRQELVGRLVSVKILKVSPHILYGDCSR